MKKILYKLYGNFSEQLLVYTGISKAQSFNTNTNWNLTLSHAKGGMIVIDDRPKIFKCLQNTKKTLCWAHPSRHTHWTVDHNPDLWGIKITFLCTFLMKQKEPK